MNLPDFSLKDIPGFDGYALDKNGSLWSIRGNGKGFAKVWRKLKPSRRKDGYEIVHICHPITKFRHNKHLHRLMLETFDPIENGEKLCALHKNGIRSDNRLENLYWGNYKQNLMDAWSHGTSKFGLSGEDNFMAKLDSGKIRFIKKASILKIKYKILAKLFGVSVACIGAVSRGETWSHIQNPWLFNS